MKGLNVPKEKVPSILLYKNEIIYNDGYQWANCETVYRNSNCYYISRGCTGCLIKQREINEL